MAAAETKEFCAGDRVLYVPRHAHGDIAHPDCEHGIVFHIDSNPEIIFVQYEGKSGVEATSPEDLVLVRRAPRSGAALSEQNQEQTK